MSVSEREPLLVTLRDFVVLTLDSREFSRVGVVGFLTWRLDGALLLFEMAWPRRNGAKPFDHSVRANQLFLMVGFVVSALGFGKVAIVEYWTLLMVAYSW